MLIREPKYYQDFHCIASACPDSCCKEWDVQIDPDAAEYYRSLPGALGDALRSALVEQDGETVMLQSNRRCPMWRDDGLCRIQAELGEEALCRVCRNFPRLEHNYGDFTEYGLELSCPEAARLILTSPIAPLICRAVPGQADAEYDEELMRILMCSREHVLNILSDPSLTPAQALAAALLYAADIQAVIDGDEVCESSPEQLLNEALRCAVPGRLSDILDLYSGLEILTDTWRSRLASPAIPGDWNPAYCALAGYGVQRYWLQTVADFDLLSRMKLVILSCILVRALGGDLLQTAQLYSKEIENDIDNVDTILEAAYASPALTVEKLLGLLLAEK